MKYKRWGWKDMKEICNIVALNIVQKIHITNSNYILFDNNYVSLFNSNQSHNFAVRLSSIDCKLYNAFLLYFHAR